MIDKNQVRYTESTPFEHEHPAKIKQIENISQNHLRRPVRPEDKFGDRIPRPVFNKLCEYGARLKQIDYQESQSKPNLFYYSPTGGVTFFMDMRGTHIQRIRTSPTPLFYWNFELTMADWAKRRMLKAERERLLEHRIPFRRAHWESDRGERLEGPFMWPDGYCQSCGKDIRSNDRFCSTDCERDHSPDSFCEACDERLSNETKVWHHVSYFPEETVTVCRSCHNKIHMDSSFLSDLTPPQDEINRFYDE